MESASLYWSYSMDARLTTLVKTLFTYTAVAEDMGLPVRQIRKRCGQLNLKFAQTGLRERTSPALHRGPNAKNGGFASWLAAHEQPKPPGHPTTWDIINAGTCLEGEPWPYR